MQPVEYESQQERKSYLHRQRPGEKGPPARGRDIGTEITPATPDTPDHVAKVISNSRAQAMRIAKARTLSPATSLTKPSSGKLSPANSLTRPLTQRGGTPESAPSASPSLDRVASSDLQRYPSVDRLRETPPTAGSRKGTSRRGDMMSTQDSVKMQGQDTLEVRSVTLPNGQSASLVLEDGKLQRIVSSAGNIVEVHWQGGRIKNEAKGGPDRQMAIKLRSAQHLVEDDGAHSQKQGGFKKLTNSLQSQRLSSSVLNSLYSSNAQPGMFTKSDKDIRSIRSLDLTEKRRQDASRPKRGYGIHGFQSTEPARTASQGDMSTIFEAEHGRTTPEWNPIGSTWLPSNMTNKQEIGRTTDSDSALQSREVRPGLDAGTQLTPSGAGTPQSGSRSGSLGKTVSRTGSLGKSASRSGSLEKGTKRPSSKEKKNIWKTIKSIFRIPSKSKGTSSPNTPRAADTTTPRSQSFGKAEGRNPSLEAADRDARFRASSPPAPTSVAVQMASLPAQQDIVEAPSASGPSIGKHTDVPFQDRSTMSSNALTNGSSAGLPSKTVTAGGATVSSTPVLPISDKIISRQYRFGPDGPENEKPNTSIEAKEEAPTKAKRPRKRSLEKPAAGQQEASKTNTRDSALLSRTRTNSQELAPRPDVPSKQRTSMAGQWQRDFTQGSSGAKVDELLNVSTLQRLAREKTMEMQIIETDTTFEMKWHIPLNGSTSKISKVDRYLKNGEVVEGARRDGRGGLLRSQLTFTPEGHVHIRALQGAPYSAVFHDRLKLSSGGRRIKIEQKFQLLEPGVPPVKHFSIWQRVE